MKITVKICRVAKVPTQFLRGCVGADIDTPPSQVFSKIIENFGPIAPGVDFFVESSKAVITKEVMAFNIQAKDMPFAGLATADMLTPNDIARVDGGIESELARMGITSDPKEYEWRALYEVTNA
jgi:hypothetical protein